MAPVHLTRRYHRRRARHDSLGSALACFFRDDAGGASVEFVVVATALFSIILVMFETGMIMARSILIDRGLQVAVREIRLGYVESSQYNYFRDRVCEEAFLVIDCENNLLLEVVPFATVAAYAPGTNPACVDRSVGTTATPGFSTGNAENIMFVRACLLIDPFFPGSAIAADLARDSTGALAITATTAFMNEPE